MCLTRCSRRRLVTLVGGALLLGCLSAALGAGRDPLPVTTVRCVVHPGDTLWALSRRTGVSDIDRRRLVRMLKQVNHLSSARIYPGQTLLIPAGRDSVKRALASPDSFAAAADPEPLP